MRANRGSVGANRNSPLRGLPITLLISFIFALHASAQTVVDGTIRHGGRTREYRLYIPAIYNPASPTPLMFNIHGYSGDYVTEDIYTGFRPVADTAGFIMVMPNGIFDHTAHRYWNVGLEPSPADDIGFIEALIDSLSLSYNIDPLRIYATGMSLGGFMCYNLACNTNRFAAIASVSGSMSARMLGSCTPSLHLSVLEIHGTEDPHIPYEGHEKIQSVVTVMNYWAGYNHCPQPPVLTTVPDLVTTDSATALHYVYEKGDKGTTVELYQIVNGGHTWPQATVIMETTCMDFSACEVIWKFFSRHTLPTE